MLFCIDGDAILLSNIYFNSDSVLKIYDDHKFASFNKNIFEQIIKHIILNHPFHIELFTYKNGSWELKGKASSGNFGIFEDILSNVNYLSSNSMCAINMKKDEKYGTQVGISSICLDNFSIVINNFFDDDALSTLESTLLLLNPKECLDVTRSSDTKLQQLVDRCKILLTKLKRSDFNHENLSNDLYTLINEKTSDMNIIKNLDRFEITKPCVASLINVLNLLGSEDNRKRFSINLFSISDFMRLDVHAIEALNLFPESRTIGNTSLNICIFNLINNTITQMGTKLIYKWIHQPLMDVKKINERLDLVETFLANPQIMNLIRKDYLPSFPNIDVIIRKFFTKRSSLKDCYKLYIGFKRLDQLIDTLKECESDHIPVLNSDIINPFEIHRAKIAKFIEMVECTIDFERINDNEFCISGNFNEELQRLDNELKSIRFKIEEEFNLTSKELYGGSSKNIKLEYSVDQKYFMRITLKEEKQLRNKPSFIIIETSKSGIKFINQNIKNLNDQFFQISKSSNELQESIIQEIIDIAKQYVEVYFGISQLIANLDAIISLAVYSQSSSSLLKRPIICDSNEGIIEIKDMKHPILERLLEGCVIPNDVILSKSSHYFNIITGPNMGGKSTFIRTVALLVYMSQIGCFLPCSYAKISITDAIMFRIGAGDSLSKGISTFMSEMLDMCSILKNATDKSLVVVDELGRGTSTYDGFGLTWSIADHILNKLKCFCLFATHFHEMTDLVKIYPHAANYHTKAHEDNQGLVMLYRIIQGLCKKSFGCNVARITGFPEHVIDDCMTNIERYEFFQSESLNSSNRIYTQVNNYLQRLREASKLGNSALKNEFEAIRCEMMSHQLLPFQKLAKISKPSIYY